MIESPDGIRKAAILVSSLDQSAAEVLLAQMPLELVERVRAALTELGIVEGSERETILAEFRDAGLRVASDAAGTPSGPVADGFAEKPPAAPAAPPPNRPQEIEPELPPGYDSAAALAGVLAAEAAPTICQVLAHLPPPLAANLLQRLPAERQAEILQRLAQGEIPPSEIGRQLSHETQEACRACRTQDGNTTPRADHGTSAATQVFEDRRRSRRVLRPVELGDPATPGETESGETPALTDFDDLVRLDDAALARVFRAAEPQLVLLALSGANRELIERIVRHLPSGAGRTLRRQITTLGPTRLRDIELAQQQLAELATQMCQAGLIHVPSRRRFTMAACESVNSRAGPW